MDNRLRIVVMVWMGLIMLCLLFPPYTYGSLHIAGGTVVKYGFLLSSPPRPGQYMFSGGIATSRLYMEFLVVTLGCLIVFLRLKYFGRSKPPS